MKALAKNERRKIARGLSAPAEPSMPTEAELDRAYYQTTIKLLADEIWKHAGSHDPYPDIS